MRLLHVTSRSSLPHSVSFHDLKSGVFFLKYKAKNMQFKPLDVIEMSAQYYELDMRWSPPIGRSRGGGGWDILTLLLNSAGVKCRAEKGGGGAYELSETQSGMLIPHLETLAFISDSSLCYLIVDWPEQPKEVCPCYESFADNWSEKNVMNV